MRKRILVVDDEEGIRDILDKVFTKAGYEVKTAEDAETGLDILEKELFPLMFLDLQLPGMNGIDLCRRVRKEHPTAILIAMTAYASVFQIVEARDAGFDDYFLKPFKIDDFLAAAEESFRKLERWRKKL
ncbi:MAG: response regulator [Candidatus Electryonea clarkiae]|nr:response regulator [Candidatus Electryonea clarkiae]MDP8289257.1 response regulator [Candidatus Electryonea clarkiae]